MHVHEHIGALVCSTRVSCLVLTRASGHKVVWRPEFRELSQLRASSASKGQESTIGFPIRDVVTVYLAGVR